MKIPIGTIRSDKNGFEALAKVAKSSRDLFIDALNLDFSSCSFFEANMTAPFYAVLSHVFDGLNEVTIVNVPDSVEKILRKNDFLSMFGFSTLQDYNQTTLPFLSVCNIR